MGNKLFVTLLTLAVTFALCSSRHRPSIKRIHGHQANSAPRQISSADSLTHNKISTHKVSYQKSTISLRSRPSHSKLSTAQTRNPMNLPETTQKFDEITPKYKPQTHTYSRSFPIHPKPTRFYPRSTPSYPETTDHRLTTRKTTRLYPRTTPDDSETTTSYPKSTRHFRRSTRFYSKTTPSNSEATHFYPKLTRHFRSSTRFYPQTTQTDSETPHVYRRSTPQQGRATSFDTPKPSNNTASPFTTDSQDTVKNTPARYPCPQYQFPCQNGACVNNDSLCDGVDNCGDTSDEDYRICLTGELEVGRCLDSHLVIGSVCDGVQHCLDGSDETLCSTRCRGMLCDHNAKCVSPSSMCDGYLDCANGLDELLCGTCNDDQFLCPTGLCISLDLLPYPSVKCWGSREPDDWYIRRMCTAPRLLCGYSQCFPAASECNGIVECYDGSDETTSRDGVICDCSSLPCRNGGCVSLTSTCNGIDDCGDGTDENALYTNCSDTNLKDCQLDEFFSGKFTCNNGMCIEKAFVRDGHNDCGDLADEIHNFDPIPPTDTICSGFLCSTGICIDTSDKCDSYNNCGDNSDEKDCDDSTWWSSDPTYKLPVIVGSGVIGGVLLLIIILSITAALRKKRNRQATRVTRVACVTTNSMVFPPNYWDVVKDPPTVPQPASPQGGQGLREAQNQSFINPQYETGETLRE